MKKPSVHWVLFIVGLLDGWWVVCVDLGGEDKSHRSGFSEGENP